MKIQSYAVLAGMIFMSACQSTSSGSSTTATPSADAASTPTTEPVAFASTQAASPATGGACAIAIAGGPPPKPAKGADFAKNAVGNNIKRNVARNSISMIGGQLGGPLGGAIAQGVASNAIRTEQDLKGQWTITDGSPDCGCTMDISSGTTIQMKSSNQGSLKTAGCRSPLLAQAARWSLGHTFTGYDAPLTILASDRRTAVANLKRDGINYFSGQLADGTPVTLWRRGG